jgi:hypothetical protein
MQRPVAYLGALKTVVYAVRANGSSPGYEFFQNELTDRERARLFWMFAKMGDYGSIANREQFKRLEGSKAKLSEFKHQQIRMLCFDLPGNLIVITHGFRKKCSKIPPNQIERAEQIKAEDEERSLRYGGD